MLTVLTVPMRNGNALGSKNGLALIFCSYRTYEEWKHSEWQRVMNAVDSSYRTYEEWKPESSMTPNKRTVCSYRTYEEWKPIESKS